MSKWQQTQQHWNSRPHDCHCLRTLGEGWGRAGRGGGAVQFPLPCPIHILEERDKSFAVGHCSGSLPKPASI